MAKTIESISQDFGTLEQYSRTHRIRSPKSAFQKYALGLKDWWEAKIAESSVHGDPPIYKNEDFPWVKDVEAGWKDIREELDGIMDRRSEMPSFHEILSQVSTITTDNNWKTFFLFAPGMDCEGNRAKCPKTTELVQKIPGLKTAMFSILSPGKEIPPHRGPYAGALRYHLGLMIPEPKEQCRIRIRNEVRHWEEGKSIVFDDTWNHQVWNHTDGYRVVLFVDFVRPINGFVGWLNQNVFKLEDAAPFLRKARDRQKAWEKNFYNQMDG